VRYWLLVAEDKSESYRLTRDGDFDSSISLAADPEAEVDDVVLLWRSGRGGGVVAIGHISRTFFEQVKTIRWMLASEDKQDNDSDLGEAKAEVEFGQLFLAAPISGSMLRTAGLSEVPRATRAVRRVRRLIALELSEEQWSELNRLTNDIKPPSALPAGWNIPPGSVVNRAELHDLFGGNPRLTVGPSGRTPNAFLFLDLDRADELALRLEGTVLLAPGQGQDDGISVENLAVLAHRRRGVPLRTFLVRGAECLYLGEFAIESERPVERWVVTGKRPPVRYDPHRPLRDTRTPLLRLRPLNGIPITLNGVDPFKDAPRIDLGLPPLGDRSSAETVRRLLTLLEAEPELATSIGSLNEVNMLATLVQRARRQAELDLVRGAVEDSGASEADLQKLIEQMTWIFGGEFLPGTARRGLTSRDQLDLTLVRPDGTLHGIELKKANIHRLVVRQRSHYIPGPDVYQAIGQAENYLRELDEKRPQILVDLGIDCRSASMTVVIGHSQMVTTGATSAEVEETFRSCNSFRTRVSITTYDRLIQNAQRTLDLA
jgi:hypothetical protein